MSPSRRRFEICIDFGTVQVVHFESSDKHEPSLTESGSEQKLSEIDLKHIGV